MAARSRRLLLFGLFVLLAAAAALWPLLAESQPPRELVIVARQVAFHVEPGSAANPTIRVAPGERLRVTLVNDDPGVTHDLSVSAWAVATPGLRGNDRASLLVEAPDVPGKFEYVCSMHPTLMRGTIEVVGTARAR